MLSVIMTATDARHRFLLLQLVFLFLLARHDRCSAAPASSSSSPEPYYVPPSPPSSTPLFQPIVIPSPHVSSSAASLSSSASSSASGFNESLSEYLLLFAAAAYSTQPEGCINAHLPQPSFTVTHSFSASVFSSTVCGYAGLDSAAARIVLAFQGSMTYSQLWEELRHDSALPVNASSSSLLVNQYFYTAAIALLPDVAAAVSNLSAAQPDYAIYLTGHSLGGALAAMLPFLLLTTSPPVSPPPPPFVLYTFGQPRLGNRAFAVQLASLLPALYRVVHWRDVIPHLPPCPTVRGDDGQTVCGPGNGSSSYYAFHSPLEVWYTAEMPQWGGGGGGGAGGSWQECRGQPAGEDARCSNGLEVFWIESHYWYFQLDVGEFCPAAISGHRRPQQRLVTPE